MTSNSLLSSGEARIYTSDSNPDTSSAGTHNHHMQHTHPLNHAHTVPPHNHNFSHMHNATATIVIPPLEVRVPAHAHTVIFDYHVHGMVYGIYEGGRASGVTVRVDKTEIPSANLSPYETDVVPYLSKDSGGKIIRGIWHEIEIIPNALTRIEANLFVQTFVRSQGGGDF